MWVALIWVVMFIAMAALATPLLPFGDWARLTGIFGLAVLIWLAYAKVIINLRVSAPLRLGMFCALLTLCTIAAAHDSLLGEYGRLYAILISIWLIIAWTAHAALAVGGWARPRGLLARALSLIVSIIVGALGATLTWGVFAVAGDGVFGNAASVVRSPGIFWSIYGIGLGLSLFLTVAGWFGAKQGDGSEAVPLVPIPWFFGERRRTPRCSQRHDAE